VRTYFDEGISFVSDPEQIQQVIWNILLNAAEAIPDGGLIHIKAGVEESGSKVFEPGKEIINITVRDTGKGFSENALSNLFTPFFTTKDGGSGLGLAIVNRIIGGLNGKVVGRNHPDGGAEITLMFKKEI
jgi:signal transduction histidine kinase